MSERPEPDLDHVREAMREHDERQDAEPAAEPEEEQEQPGGDEED